jgi:hypothetical protein
LRPLPRRQIMMDLSGWNVRSMACGPAHFVVAADESVITWGAGTNGELAYGAEGKKSSANPAKCYALEGMHVHQVSGGRLGVCKPRGGGIAPRAGLVCVPAQ